MPSILLYVAAFLALVKIVSTIWYALQPDATTVTDTARGRALYYAGKFSPALFMATLLVRAYIQGAPSARITFWAVLFVVTAVMAMVAIRQRAAGTSFGLVHDIKCRRRGRHCS